ncbi:MULTISPECIES: hypothetical protein [unclassified Lentimonas]|uniref:hypothetical protein n=1 Tax=unclassified Lentimonas TaxID=2630993 RepID=UPI0013245BD5|nr:MULTISPECIES: hypothetical protein [unclassified Lentimonas]CAA6694145.1 Unannotated [Lentimonas sp. CC10]CAA6694354.1 Unannotated [Lentimonas sp. CC19]CAA7071100.1 Unannotated [Lentimonas sp. CC11]
MKSQNSTTIKTLTTFACFSAMALLNACTPKAELEPGLDELSARFQAANKADTIEPMLDLYYLEGCDKMITSRLKGALNFELGFPIERIEFEPLSGASEETIEFTYNGASYGPSLEPRYRMKVLYAVEDRFTSLFTVGKNPKGEWQIICAKPKPPLRY